MERMVRLESGRWYVRLEEDARGREFLYLSLAGRPVDSMRVRLPFSWRGLDDDAMQELARKPELRIWMDEHSIRWKVAAVGPGTPYPFPFSGRYLVFDSERAWAGLVRAPGGRELGELGDEELRELRDSIMDFGGTRHGFRPPEETPEEATEGARGPA